MLEMCEKPERVDELDEECVQRWRRLRIEFVEMTRERNWMAPRLQLPDAYFDNLLGHGPLRRLPSTQLRHPSLPEAE